MIARIRFVLSHANPIRLLIGFFLYRTGFCKLFVIRFDRYKIRFFKTALSRTLFINRSDRNRDELFFAKVLRPGDVVVDVGANIGQLSILASVCVGPFGKVYSFEPHPRIYRFLRHNVLMNRLQNILTFNIALGEVPGQLYFTDHVTDDINSITSIKSSLKVEVDTVNNVLPLNEHVHLLKIDTEGFELMVLKGAGSALQRVSLIYFEASEASYRANGYSFSQLSAFLAYYGFEIFQMSANRLIKIDELNGRNYNLLAIQNMREFMQKTNNAFVLD